MASSGTVDPGIVRRPRACIPCHERKVKCNASHTGLPCTRCLRRGRVAACELVPLPDRSSARLKTRKRQSSNIHIEQVQCESPESDAFDASTSSADRISEKARKYPTAIYNPYSPDRPPCCHSKGHSPCALCSTPALRDSSIGCKVQGRDINTVAEEDCQLETCLKLAQTDNNRSDMTSGTSPSQGREVFAYHGGIDSTTILGQILGHQMPRRFVKILLHEPHGVGDESADRLDAKSMDYLRSVGALDIPPPLICQELVQLYFQRVFPYVPVLNRLAFMRKLADRTCSIFLLQCIFSSVTPYMSTEQLVKIGYSDRAQAQRALFSKAQLLCDLRAERSQLCLLQGSLVLTISYFAFGLDKDCRFWLSNAVRIAAQMGLHRKQITEELCLESRKLFTRIFWVMYARDVIMVMGGRVNVRELDDRYCDMPEVTEDDWEDEPEHQLAAYGLSPIPAVQKSYLVHSSRLARICAHYVELFRRPDVQPTRAACDDLEKQMFQWRTALSPELHPETVGNWSHENVWILVLRAMGYRLESFLYRDLRGLARLEQDQFGRRALQKQKNAMLELDSIFQRIMLHDLVGLCPLSMTTCASTTIAMHIECALSPYSTAAQWQLSQTSIHSGLAYLRASLQHWDCVRWSLRMFDVMVSNSRLSLTTAEHHKVDLTSVHGYGHSSNTAVDQALHPGASSIVGQGSTRPTLLQESTDPAWISLPTNPTFATTDPTFISESISLDDGQEGSFNGLSVENLFNAYSLQASARGV